MNIYPQLFKAWPILDAILESLKVDLVIARNESKNKGNIATETDYIESMVFGNKSLNDAPPSGKISDSTGNIAANYSNVLSQDKKKYMEEWKEFAAEVGKDYLDIAAVTEKLGIAFKKLTLLQQTILKLYYWENKVWKEVRACISDNISYKSESAVKAERDRAINKMAVILKNSMEYSTYEAIMKKIDKKNEGL